MPRFDPNADDAIEDSGFDTDKFQRLKRQKCGFPDWFSRQNSLFRANFLYRTTMNSALSGSVRLARSAKEEIRWLLLAFSIRVNWDYLSATVGQQCDLGIDLDLISLVADPENHMWARRSRITLASASRNDDGFLDHRS